MLPISAGLPLILSGKKRPAKKEVGAEARPPARRLGCGRIAGWAVFDPAPPAHSRGRQREPPASPGTVSGRGLKPWRSEVESKGRDGQARPLTTARRLSASLGPTAAPSSPGKSCGGAVWATRP